MKERNYNCAMTLQVVPFSTLSCETKVSSYSSTRNQVTDLVYIIVFLLNMSNVTSKRQNNTKIATVSVENVKTEVSGCLYTAV